MKSIDGAASAALDAGRYGVRNVVLFDLPSGRWGMIDDIDGLSWGGDTYVGAAGRFTVQYPPGGTDMAVRGLTVILSSLDTAALAWVQNQSYHQRPMFAARVVLTTDGTIASVKRWFVGAIDQVKWQEKVDGEGRLVIACESASRELDRSGARTRSDADQRSIDPTDGFFKHTVGAISTEIEWGQVPPQAPQRRRWWQIF